jgi:hypothetical protein
MEDDAHTFTNIGWQALKLVKKLKDHPRKGARSRSNAHQVREGLSTPLKEPNAPGESGRREAVESDLVAAPATSDRRGM